MRTTRGTWLVGSLLTLLTLLTTPALAFTLKCPADSVQVGTTCVHTYEASLWIIPVDQTGLVKLVKEGKATLAGLLAGGATQVGCTFAPFSHTAIPGTFPANGNWTDPLYAASIPGVLPSACVTWFQAEQACRLSDKRLSTNQEWQAAAAGTPDPAVDDEATTCNIDGPPFGPTNTGSRTACTSKWGAWDMVGNVWEWVADWVPLRAGSFGSPLFSGDENSLAGDTHAAGTAALLRGGGWGTEALAGVFAVNGGNIPSLVDGTVGFRCAR